MWQDAIKYCVAEYFIQNGKSMTVADIAAAMTVSPATIRRHMNKHGGCIDGIEARQEHRQSFSKDYPSFETGSHKVWTYSPSKQTLIEIIRRERAR